LLQLFPFAIPSSKSTGRNCRTHQTNQQVGQLFCDSLPRSIHKFSWLWLFVNHQHNTLYCCIDFSMSQHVSTPSGHLQVFITVSTILSIYNAHTYLTQFTVTFD
jgi:hypothetical protein